ncbi:hypothetical protein SCLCIDRAFT_1143614 [Scleroderma citrinum Foug A]|uniref:DUF6533 domain-containing protein n=1 Tax=Scleroderma citrinum Foug A TaxID=1036808 RepID=A0A0C2Z5F8_9AGAM|nr:hypothetical protein SCLCIDRAFT_1143614 [Scleroderma citrinum Foug A]
MSSQLDIDRLFTAVVFTLVLYDYTLTIGQEIELFWKRSWRSWTFFLFIANRYITVFGRVPLLVYSFWSSEIDSDLSQFTRCNSLFEFFQVEISVVQVIGAVIMTMRVYALYGNSRRILIFLVMYLLGAGVVGFVGLSQQSPTALGVCDSQFISRSTTSNIIYGSSTDIALIWIGQLIFDVFVFLLTLLQTLRIHKEGQRSIMDVFLRDGVSVTIVFPPRLISLNC